MANLVTYAKQKWEDAKTAITAARLNNMEQGINDCATQINALGDSVCQRQIVANSNEGQKAEVNASEWQAGAYYLTASSPYNLTLFDALVVIARDNAEVGLTVLHGSATSSGKVITINGIPWYSNVVRITLAYNNN